VNNSDFWPIFNDTRNYRARFYWLDVASAVTTSVPDTLDYFDSVVGIDDNRTLKDDHFSVFRVAGGHLCIEQITSPALLQIYGIDGREFLSCQVSGNEVIPLFDIPCNLLVIRLTDGKESRVQKIVNLY
jgi:hypothetical protein